MPKVTLVPGDGIGPEVVAATVKVLGAARADVDWEEVEAGADAFTRYGSALPEQTIEVVRRNAALLKGPMTTPQRGYPSPNMGLRMALGTYANVRSARHYPPGGRSRYPGFEVTVIRDVTEDLGRGATQVIGDGEAGAELKVISRRGAERLARFTFRWARDHGQRRVTVAHQAPSQRATDGLFLRTVKAVAASEFPDLTLDDEAMDGVCMHLAIDPAGYQVLLAPNLYGGILCGLCAGLAGSVGLMPGAVFGDGTALFEPGHGSAPSYAGRGKVNPTATVLSGAMLLDHLGQRDAAERVRGAVAATIAEGKHVTYDLGGRASTSAMADAICAQLG